MPHFVQEILLAFFLGFTQGATEFLPVSSTAHMRLVSEVFLQKDFGLAASNVIQAGTLVAILQFYFDDVKRIFVRFFELLNPKNLQQFFQNIKYWINQKNKNELDTISQTQLTDIEIAQMTIATLPIIIIGFLLRDFIDEYLRSNLVWIGLFLILGAFLMASSDFYYSNLKKKNQIKNGQNVSIFSPVNTLIIGLFQSFAVFPGVSRSGGTISGSFFLGKSRKLAVRFSFLLALPAIGLSSLYDFFKILTDPNNSLTFLPGVANFANDKINLSLLSLGIAVITSYFSGLIFLKWLLRFLANKKLYTFVFYRLILGAVIILWSFL